MQGAYWSAEKTAELRRLLNDGYTYRQICRALNVSKNSLIGRVHRIKAAYPAGAKIRAQRAAAKRGKANRAKPERYVRQTRAAKKFLTLLKERQHVHVDWSVEPPSLRLSFIELEEGQCKYVHGDPKRSDHHFCGHPQQNLGPYCRFHASVCYAKPREKNEKSVAKTR